MARSTTPRPTLRRRSRHSSIRNIEVEPVESGPSSGDAAVAADDDAAAARILGVTRVPVDARERLRMIEQAAYYRAEHRGFETGHEVEDWLAAEREIDALLLRSAPA